MFLCKIQIFHFLSPFSSPSCIMGSVRSSGLHTAIPVREVSFLELSLQREIRQVMGQQMYQSLAFLQMSAEEMDEELRELSMENPLLEEIPSKKPLESRLISMHSGSVRKHDGNSLDLPIPDRSTKTFTDFLIDQILPLKLSPNLEKALRHLIINLDDRGYLLPGIRESRAWKNSPKLYGHALQLLRSLEPAGVGAENLSDCLCLQLEALGLQEHPACRICQSFLEHLARDHFHHIARELGISESEVVKAAEIIRSLNPIPSNGFRDQRESAYVVPDVILQFEDGEPVLCTSEDYMPSYCINPYYLQMSARDDLSEEEKNYFREKLESAKQAVSCVKHRKETLLRCAEEIVRAQWAFFAEDSGTLQPLTMSETAGHLGVHLSTVSRAVKNKYLSCRKGTFPLSSFFVAEVCGDTADEILVQIRRILSEEDRNHPLSDQRICEELHRRGYDIARRTVAKYREAANIPSATGRKERNVN